MKVRELIALFNLGGSANNLMSKAEEISELCKELMRRNAVLLAENNRLKNEVEFLRSVLKHD